MNPLPIPLQIIESCLSHVTRIIEYPTSIRDIGNIIRVHLKKFLGAQKKEKFEAQFLDVRAPNGGLQRLCSLYLLYWYKSTHTDAARARAPQARACRCMRLFAFRRNLGNPTLALWTA
jgi:hypothetical protein